MNQYNYEVGDCCYVEKAASMRKQRMGNPACWSGFSLEMQRMRTSNYDFPPNRREKYKGFKEKA